MIPSLFPAFFPPRSIPSFLPPFLHLNRYLLSTYYKPGTVLDYGYGSNEETKSLPSLEFRFKLGEADINHDK